MSQPFYAYEDFEPGMEIAFGTYEVTADEIRSFAEQFDLLLSRLPEESLRSLALLKLQGYTNEEIADRMDCVTRTVERKMRRIRNLWSTDEAPT